MSQIAPKRIGPLKDPEKFIQLLAEMRLDLPVDMTLESGAASPLGKPAAVDGMTIGNRWTIHPMEGWDANPDGTPTDATFRRWERFGLSGAKLIWGGEAVAVRHDGRANPNQLLMNDANLGQIAELRRRLIKSHITAAGTDAGLVVGLQLTHSGRYSKPNDPHRLEPKIAFRHPLLDRRLGLGADYPLLKDDQIFQIIDDTVAAAVMAARAGYDFVDIKHCHGYLGHELLGAHTRPGTFGGSLSNRMRYLREIVAGIRANAPGLRVGVRLSFFDLIPFHADPNRSAPGKPGPGIPQDWDPSELYRYGFGMHKTNPLQIDYAEPMAFLGELAKLGVRLVNLSAGSPYYNPHIQRPAVYPPSDGYLPPEDPLVGVARQIHAVRKAKIAFPDLYIVGTGYTYLQDFLPHVAQAVVRNGWADSVGLGRMVLSYPEMPLDVFEGKPLRTKRVCRTFSDCTTAPRNGLPSGCYPLDDYYTKTPANARLKVLKKPRLP